VAWFGFGPEQDIENAIDSPAMRKAGRILLAALGVAVLALVVLLLWPKPRLDLKRLAAARRYDVRILRDTWGVPHVFGKTDPDVAYGLAWAHAEDDFPTIQGALLAARGRLATVLGPKGAPNDYMVQLLRVWDVVDARYDKDLSAETRALCQAYADGINAYAAQHPGEAMAPLYPATGKDVVAGFVHKTPLFFGLDKTLTALLEPARKPKPSPAFSPGSNTIAVAPRRSADRFTRLAINSHQPWEGPVAWYEAHLHSETGWDTVGGLFPGAPIVLHGHNRDLGWAHTVNRPDLIDVYALQLNPANPDQYRFDGAWRDLEKRTAAIEVRLLGPLSWTVHRELLWSVYGAVLRGPRGTFAVRFAGWGDVRAVEEWYRMNRARSFDEWMSALRMGAVPMFNCGYADRTGTIAYVYNARLPLRDPGYDWSQQLPGDTSKTLWTEYLPLERLPQVVNPASGFVQNSNSSPFRTTLGDDNPRQADYPASFGIETKMTNRSLRSLELLGADESITREEFDRYKFDQSYSRDSAMADALRRVLAAPPPGDDLTQRALELLKGWDLSTDAADTRAALAVLAFRPTDDNTPRDGGTDRLMDRLTSVARRLQSRFGRLDVPWGEVMRLRHGAVDLGLGGAPDILRAVYPRAWDELPMVGAGGDSYVLLVEWDTEGQVHSRSIHQYGSATRDEGSPHYADQAPFFAACRLKPVWLDEAEIRTHLEREYQPGEAR
jgi:penicillin amidase/acyl-homoserine-lactone acylase